MRTQVIQFPNNRSICVTPDAIENLQGAIDALGIKEHCAVVALIGGQIQERHFAATKSAIQTIAEFVEESKATIICGGTDMGVLALVGQVKAENQYTFPLLGVTVEDLVTWPKGPRSRRFLGWGKKRCPLAEHYSHFVLVPGDEFGDESAWIVEIGSLLSRGHRAVTILANGGAISRLDIQLSLEYGRPVIALAGTGRFADELASQTEKPKNVVCVHAEDGQAIRDTLREYI